MKPWASLKSSSCGFLTAKNLVAAAPALGKMGVDGGTPLRLPFECLAGRGFRKKCLQNLEAKELRGQNLENNGVRGGPMRLAALRAPPL